MTELSLLGPWNPSTNLATSFERDLSFYLERKKLCFSFLLRLPAGDVNAGFVRAGPVLAEGGVAFSADRWILVRGPQRALPARQSGNSEEEASGILLRRLVSIQMEISHLHFLFIFFLKNTAYNKPDKTIKGGPCYRNCSAAPIYFWN